MSEPAAIVTPSRNDASFVDLCRDLRSGIKAQAATVLVLKQNLPSRAVLYRTDSVPDFGEMAANVTLAYRHLEDASMRIGKAIQAFDGGVSCYDKTTVGAPDTGAADAAANPEGEPVNKVSEAANSQQPAPETIAPQADPSAAPPTTPPPTPTPPPPEPTVPRSTW